MAVYVDSAVHRFGRMIMCHMLSPNVEELHLMADLIGVRRKWFQDPRTMNVSHPHYDIARVKRALAVRNGAIEINRYQMVVVANVAVSRYLGREPGDPLRVFRAKKLERCGTVVEAHPRLQEVEKWAREQGLIPDRF